MYVMTVTPIKDHRAIKSIVDLTFVALETYSILMELVHNVLIFNNPQVITRNVLFLIVVISKFLSQMVNVNSVHLGQNQISLGGAVYLCLTQELRVIIQLQQDSKIYHY